MTCRFTGARCATVALLAALVAGGCAATAHSVDLSGRWPAQPGPYRRVTRDWTRHATLRANMYQQLNEVLDVHATLESPVWRAAYVSHRAVRELLSAKERGALESAQRQEAAKYNVLEVMVATHNRNENNLDEGKKSIWKLRLVSSTAAEVAPVDIQQDRRPRQVIRADFPDLSDFGKAYIVKFPATPPMFGKGAEWVALKMSSPRGAVNLVWKAHK